MKPRGTARTGLRALLWVWMTMAAPAGAAQDDRAVLQAFTDPSFVPFEMLDAKTGGMVGFDMDILAAVAQRAGFDYKLETMSFRGIIPALQTGSADIAIAGITITKKREQVVDFSIPYYQSGLRILVSADNDAIKTMADLQGKTIATKIGSTSYEYLSGRFGEAATIKPYPRTASMYMALLSGAVDAVVYDAPNVAYFASKKGAGRVEMVGPLYEAQPYGLAFVEGSPWVDKANAALRSMKADGSYAKIHRKWFGEPPPTSSTPAQTSFQFDWQTALDCLPFLLTGLPLTLLISIAGIAIGFALALFFGLASLAPSRILAWPAIAYIEVFRGTPVLVQVLFIFYGLPQLLGGPINAVTAAIAAIAVNAGAYFSEIVRGGVQSIDRGQTEAGLSCGLSSAQPFVYIVWPQALRRMIPALGNQCIVSIKDTSLFAVIGVGEMLRQAQIYIATTFKALEVYLMVAVLYLCITLTLSLLLRWLERSGLVGERA
ncbi:MAG: ABC transporter substrate-binding protein/permease [Salinisphaera sp.]|nr:ABC transporter substrate-binding protein/permease [Salinisphaera sp.]